MKSIAAVVADIDAANSHDPNEHDGEPLAREQGRLGTAWLARLSPNAPPAVQVAVRAHHLRRWELRRTDYPAGRAGYLRWRRDNKAHQAHAASEILSGHAWSDSDIARVGDLLGRHSLRSDPHTQLLEDVACLVFLETQFVGMVERTDRAHMVDIVAKTLAKMSREAIELASEITLPEHAASVIRDASGR